MRTEGARSCISFKITRLICVGRGMGWGVSSKNDTIIVRERINKQKVPYLSENIGIWWTKCHGELHRCTQSEEGIRRSTCLQSITLPSRDALMGGCKISSLMNAHRNFPVLQYLWHFFTQHSSEQLSHATRDAFPLYHASNFIKTRKWTIDPHVAWHWFMQRSFAYIEARFNILEKVV